MDHFGLPMNPAFNKQIFQGSAITDGVDWQTWIKPKGKSQVFILCIGAGGGGGQGVIGAVSTAAGGGGGGSGALTFLVLPAEVLPDNLYVQVGGDKTGAGLVSRVAIYPNTTATNQVTIARGGAVGGNASGATAGTAGAGGAITAVADAPLFWAFHSFVVAGQAGTAGGTTGAGPSVAVPLTGLRMTGGAGGAGLGATAVAGTAGGNITGIGPFLTLAGGAGGTSATVAPLDGRNGPAQNVLNNMFWFGGSGGGSTHGSASGAGLRQSNGGDGGVGSGGGGNGGAFTGSASAASRISKGGPGLVVIWAV